MINNNEKTSLLVRSQLPEFLQANSDYENFKLFIEAYYEWMEQSGQVTERTKNLLSYSDIDKTTDEFLDYFTNEFLPYFPAESLLSKEKAIKVARQLYETKGTPASYKFLFRVLYDSDFDVFYTKEAVLKASDGKWYVAKSLKLASVDPHLLNINNYRLFGETTKSIATVENSVLAGTKTEVFISNIERLFQSGEFVRVVDSNNQDVLFNGSPLRAKIVGQISQVKIDPNNRGLLYQVGDPVVIYDGLSSNTGLGASAVVGSTTSGSIQRINVINGGFGYSYSPNTEIDITNAPGAIAIVGSVDPKPSTTANIALFPIDTISLKRYIKLGNSNYYFANGASVNANTTLAEALTFKSFSTYPLSSISVMNGGGGITKTPVVTALSGFPNDVAENASVSAIGMLAPIQITSGGEGYQANDTIVFTGGSGRGARANVLTVNSTGAITSVGYVFGPNKDYPLGGMGYKTTDLPGLTVNSANNQAANAQLYVPGILGEGATFSVVVDRVGSVTTINLVDPGEDYIETPNVSLKVQDIVVSNVSIANLPNKGDVIYQGSDANNITYRARVNSISQLTSDANTELSLWNLRVFEYNSNPDPMMPLVVDKNINYLMANTAYNSNYNSSGVRNYGDATAKAAASFLNGLVISQGQYLNSQGQPSSFNVLQSSIYNNFTYQVTVQESISKYRDVLLNLLHPTGMKVLGRHALKSSNNFRLHTQDALYTGQPLYNYTGIGSSVSIKTDFTNKSNNILVFNDISTANLQTFLFSGNTTISLRPTNGPNVVGKIVSVNTASNTAVIDSNVWLTFANVATVTANAGSNVINITSLTGKYDIINNGKYSNTAYPLMDIVYTGDNVLVDNNTSRLVSSVDYINGKIYLSSDITTDANSYLAVSRTFVANSKLNFDQVSIFGPVGQSYINPELITEDGFTITTEDGTILLVG